MSPSNSLDTTGVLQVCSCRSDWNCRHKYRHGAGKRKCDIKYAKRPFHRTTLFSLLIQGFYSQLVARPPTSRTRASTRGGLNPVNRVNPVLLRSRCFVWFRGSSFLGHAFLKRTALRNLGALCVSAVFLQLPLTLNMHRETVRTHSLSRRSSHYDIYLSFGKL